MRAAPVSTLAAAFVFGSACARESASVSDSAVVLGDGALPPDLAPPPDLAGAPAGTRLVATTGVLAGVTRDDHALYFDENAGGAAFVVGLGGGAPHLVSGRADRAVLDGLAAAVWHDTAAGTRTGRLTVWTAAAGAHELALASTQGLFAARPDGTYVAYTAAASDDGRAAELWVARPDGSDAKRVLAEVLVGSLECPPLLAAAGGRFLLARCGAKSDGGGPASSTVSSIDPATGATTTLLTAARDFFSASATGDAVFLVSDHGDGMVVPTAGGEPTPIAAGVDTGALLPDGSAVVYRGVAKQLLRAATSAPAPVLLALGAASFEGLAPDGAHALYTTLLTPQLHLHDLAICSTHQAGESAVIDDQPTAAIYGDAFTANSRRVLYLAITDTTHYVGTLISVPAAGGPPTTHGPRAWIAYAYGQAGRIVYNDHFTPVPMRRGRADLRAVDTAAADPPHLLAPQAEVDIALSTARDQIVYFYLRDNERAGLYVAPLP